MGQGGAQEYYALAATATRAGGGIVGFGIMIADVRSSRQPKNAQYLSAEETCAMPNPAYKHLSATLVDDVVVVEITTKEVQNPPVAQELGAELASVATEFRARKFLLDFTHVRYLGSVAFAALSRAVKNVRGAGSQIKFCSMQPSVRSAADVIFGADIVGSQHAVEVQESLAKALVSFAMS
jgi:anti-anti-sigma factor